MTPLEKNGRSIALIGRDVKIVTVQDLLDLFAPANYDFGCTGLIVFEENLGEEFFDLKTRVAGELLQKCSNYRVRIAVVGDFSRYDSKSLRDFIRECNRGNLIFFKGTVEEALEALTRS
jgi:hypothetical protein